MEKIVVLNKNTLNKEVFFNVESPYVRITKITIPLLSNITEEILQKVSIDFLKINTRDENESKGSLYIGRTHYLSKRTQKEFEIEKLLIGNDDFNKLQLIYNNISDEDLEIHVHYKTINHDVALVNPFENFKRHIEQSDNVKILFSAPFGQGKSTFLNYFFEEQHKEEYEVFKVFPVNYSISHNEDVFKYIKAEILFKLLKTDVTFDKESFSYVQTAPQFFNSDPIRVFSALIPLIPKIGKSTFEILDPLFKLAKDYFDYHNGMKIDDEKDAKDFIEELYKKEGSIFEDNFYTQLIRQLLERLKADTGKDNVLIIEDLDRMDPDHIFRILNIFAAHFDAPDWEDGMTNKFGFDKIIIVGDYNNIKHTFAYRYGDKVDFGGYINKYYSKAPFYYDNKAAITQFAWTLRKNKYGKNNVGLNLLLCVLGDLIDVNAITLRDLLKLGKFNAYDILSGNYTSSKEDKHLYNGFLYFNLFLYLTKVFDIDSLIQKITLCKNVVEVNEKWPYNNFVAFGLPSFVLNKTFLPTIQSEPIKLTENFGLSFQIEQMIRQDFGFLKAIHIHSDSNAVEFTKADFYELLILNAEKYKEVGGFN